MTKEYRVRIYFDPPPIRTREMDWHGYVDGMEEDTSVSDSSPVNVLYEVADKLEEADCA